jgi:hypothetical protein
MTNTDTANLMKLGVRLGLTPTQLIPLPFVISDMASRRGKIETEIISEGLDNKYLRDLIASLCVSYVTEAELRVERDSAKRAADELAGLIAAITGVDIGEHSNLNNPWERAAEAADAYLKRSK